MVAPLTARHVDAVADLVHSHEDRPQWRSRLSDYVPVNGGHFEILNRDFLTFLFVLLIPVSVNLININLQSLLILREMCYFCA